MPKPNQFDLMVLAEKHAKTCGYIARARAPHAHVREENAQKRGKSAAFRVDLGQKKTPCKQLARGVFDGAADLPRFMLPREVVWQVHQEAVIAKKQDRGCVLFLCELLCLL